jgi:hypothetical protein
MFLLTDVSRGLAPGFKVLRPSQSPMLRCYADGCSAVIGTKSVSNSSMNYA